MPQSAGVQRAKLTKTAGQSLGQVASGTLQFNKPVEGTAYATLLSHLAAVVAAVGVVSAVSAAFGGTGCVQLQMLRVLRQVQRLSRTVMCVAVSLMMLHWEHPRVVGATAGKLGRVASATYFRSIQLHPGGPSSFRVRYRRSPDSRRPCIA